MNATTPLPNQGNQLSPKAQAKLQELTSELEKSTQRIFEEYCPGEDHSKKTLYDLAGLVKKMPEKDSTPFSPPKYMQKIFFSALCALGAISSVAFAHFCESEQNEENSFCSYLTGSSYLNSKIARSIGVCLGFTSIRLIQDAYHERQKTGRAHFESENSRTIIEKMA